MGDLPVEVTPAGADLQRPRLVAAQHVAGALMHEEVGGTGGGAHFGEDVVDHGFGGHVVAADVDHGSHAARVADLHAEIRLETQPVDQNPLMRAGMRLVEVAPVDGLRVEHRPLLETLGAVEAAGLALAEADGDDGIGAVGSGTGVGGLAVVERPRPEVVVDDALFGSHAGTAQHLGQLAGEVLLAPAEHVGGVFRHLDFTAEDGEVDLAQVAGHLHARQRRVHGHPAGALHLGHVLVHVPQAVAGLMEGDDAQNGGFFRKAVHLLRLSAREGRCQFLESLAHTFSS
ncbi:hypothetical protein DVU_2601 [Nitratidesulfovibrio vulgaris str. Hildenborough]|uniref:Uncharacterized protein n=1 Tax=Nitratidesulfovibrio vulgaris (strain ATCC 29579 / DSM 644 / CCUG 34227 / NCIMB 8303 / VKM B-1760 / Hildenborough) TaxID=882 RepID=Q728K2_NITV2|nr:hypothetical protein DVU_2601 [Nitratidesulfovibrio vulgaris str. Hildenborough]